VKRRHSAAILVAVLAAFGGARPAPARASEPAAGARPASKDPKGTAVDRRTREAIRRGLAYLAEQQNPNGSWTDKVGRKVHMYYSGIEAEHVGVTALAGMAFLASGSLPDQGPYGRQVRGALDYVLEQVLENGFIAANGSRMYCHAFATLFLAECYGMTRDERVGEKLRMAIRLIVEGQNPEGGWRYLPKAEDADMSVTVCQVLALRGARNAGILVPRSTIDRAVQYVKDSYREEVGAFDYQKTGDRFGMRARTSFALTAAGTATLFGAGEYGTDARSREMVRKGLDFIWRNRPEAEMGAGHFDYYYGQYYAVQAMFQAGGSFWSAWWPYIRDDLLRIQSRNGSWRDLVGANYATAMATIILQMPFQYLPITER
jgi:hypothetical protein